MKFNPSLEIRIDLAAKRYRDWVINDALPLWARNGRNPEGGFYENLLPDGEPDTTADTRTRVNTRQVYCFAYAAWLKWHDDAAEIAIAGDRYVADFCLLEKGFDGTGDFPGMGYLLGPDFAMLDDKVDAYTHAFYLLAMAWLYRATRDERYLAQATKAIAFMDERLAPANGLGWSESIPPSLPRRQNPHMHLFEAFMALYQASGRQLFLDKATHVYTLFETHFYDAENGVLLEFFDEDWQPHAGTGDLIEPGHMMEWCWLLSVYAQITGRDLTPVISRMYDEALTRGLNPRTGLLFDEVRLDGTVTKPTHRSWAITEFLKASIALARLGDSDAAAKIPDLTDQMFAAYLEADVAGGWHDQRDRDGKVITDRMPSSTFYHYICACAELSDLAASLTPAMETADAV